MKKEYVLEVRLGNETYSTRGTDADTVKKLLNLMLNGEAPTRGEGKGEELPSEEFLKKAAKDNKVEHPSPEEAASFSPKEFLKKAIEDNKVQYTFSDLEEPFNAIGAEDNDEDDSDDAFDECSGCPYCQNCCAEDGDPCEDSDPCEDGDPHKASACDKEDAVPKEVDPRVPATVDVGLTLSMLLRIPNKDKDGNPIIDHELKSEEEADNLDKATMIKASVAAKAYVESQLSGNGRDAITRLDEGTYVYTKKGADELRHSTLNAKAEAERIINTLF